MNGEVTSSELLPAPSLAWASAMISSLFQALNLVVTGRKKFLAIFTGIVYMQAWNWI
jgi:hypothetical protein